MRIAYGSDIHAEFEDQKAVLLPGPVDVLILAGDITKAKHLAAYAAQYRDQGAQNVVVVGGNHERYGSELNRSIEKAQQDAAQYNNVHILECSSVVIGDWTFIGATAWTDFRLGGDQGINMLDASNQMNDYKKIKKFTGSVYRRLKPLDVLRENEKAKAFIFSELALAGPQSIVITHHAPTSVSIPERYQSQPLNPCYVNTWGNDIAYTDGPAYWFHGHIHDPSDYEVGDTRVLCNPVGYPGQIPGSGFKILDI